MIVKANGRVGAILDGIWKPLALLAIVNCAVTLICSELAWPWLAPKDVPLPLLGTGLVVFLGLRNNAAYARWWEARSLWGAVVNNSRNFARTVTTVLAPTGKTGAHDRLICLQIAWAKALRLSLRGEKVLAGLETILSGDEIRRIEGAVNIPFAIQREIGHLIGEELQGRRLDGQQFLALSNTLDALTDAQGGLERIRNTPMPQHYALLPFYFVMLYCVLLPFGVVGDLGFVTPVGCLVIDAIFLTLDRAGANLENPFARSAHDLPMTAISRTIEIDLKEAISHEDQPRPLRAIRGILR